MTASVDTLCDLLVSLLKAKDFVTDWSYPGNVEIEAVSLPSFSLIEATNVTQIKVSGYPNVELEKVDRGTVQGDIKIGIAIVRKIINVNGIPDEEEFRLLKGLAESVYMWVWTATTGYEKKVIKVDFPAWFDFERAKEGVFLTTINPVFRLGFEL